MKTLTTKTTHIAKVRQLNANQIDQVCEFLSWTRLEYCQYQYSQYEKFIARLCEDEPYAATVIRYSPVFRGLFCNEWMKRNDERFNPLAKQLTEDCYEVDCDGELQIYDGLPFGHDAFKYEYNKIHNAKALFYDQDLAVKVNHLLSQILPYA
jgi:hypothetical protein